MVYYVLNWIGKRSFQFFSQISHCVQVLYIGERFQIDDHILLFIS